MFMDIQPQVAPKEEIPAEVKVVAQLAQQLVPQLMQLQWSRRQYEFLIDIIEDHLGLTGPSEEEVAALTQRSVEPREERVEVKGNVTIVDRRRKFE